MILSADKFLTRTTGISSTATTTVRTGNSAYQFAAMACSDVDLKLRQVPGEEYTIRIASTYDNGEWLCTQVRVILASTIVRE